MIQGAFAWYDLAVEDLPAAVAFYTAVLGWTAKPMTMEGMDFTMFHAGAVPVAAVRALGDLPTGAALGWRGFIGVDDVGAMAEQAVAARAVLRHGPVGSAGRQFAVLDDPQGARFAVCTRFGEDDAPVMNITPGHVGWRELASPDPEAAFSFYAGLFGWTKDTAMDMGEMGVYQLIAVDGGDGMGAIMPVPPAGKAGWGYYFATEALDAAMARVNAAGGQVVHGPHPVPGEVWIAQCVDPQGAGFSLVGPRG
jgi:predicted enzyme related to lactoylglutathione lyase